MGTVFLAVRNDDAFRKRVALKVLKRGMDTDSIVRPLEKSADVFRRGLAAHPSNAMFRRNLAVVNSNTADVLLALDRRDEALAEIELLDRLAQQKSIEVTDVKTLDAAREELARIRADLAAAW